MSKAVKVRMDTDSEEEEDDDREKSPDLGDHVYQPTKPWREPAFFVTEGRPYKSTAPNSSEPKERLAAPHYERSPSPPPLKRAKLIDRAVKSAEETSRAKAAVASIEERVAKDHAAQDFEKDFDTLFHIVGNSIISEASDEPKHKEELQNLIEKTGVNGYKVNIRHWLTKGNNLTAEDLKDVNGLQLIYTNEDTKRTLYSAPLGGFDTAPLENKLWKNFNVYKNMDKLVSSMINKKCEGVQSMIETPFHTERAWNMIMNPGHEQNKKAKKKLTKLLEKSKEGIIIVQILDVQRIKNEKDVWVEVKQPLSIMGMITKNEEGLLVLNCVGARETMKDAVKEFGRMDVPQVDKISLRRTWQVGKDDFPFYRDKTKSDGNSTGQRWVSFMFWTLHAATSYFSTAEEMKLFEDNVSFKWRESISFIILEMLRKHGGKPPKLLKAKRRKRENPLLIKGYAVIQLKPEDAATARAWFNSFVEDPNIPEFTPEFNEKRARGETDDPFSLFGAFGAISWASSYHHPAAIGIDEIAMRTARPILEETGRALGLNYVSLIADRMCYRTKPQAGESAHRDNTRGAEAPSDKFYGGFVNLNETKTQYFTLFEGTQLEETPMNGKAFTKEQTSTEELARRRVEVPPGHMIIVAENILHEVDKSKTTSPIKRKFTAFLLRKTNHQWCVCFDKFENPLEIRKENHVLCPRLKKRCEDQAPLLFKGGEIGPSYPRLYWNFPKHRAKLLEKSKNFVQGMKTDREVMSGGEKGRVYENIVKVEPPSLKELGVRYDVDSFSRFIPQEIKRV